MKHPLSRLTLSNPMDYTVHGILQARILKWEAIPFSRGSSQPRNLNRGLLLCRWILYQLSYQGSPYIQNKNKPTDIENKFIVTKRERGEG